MLMILRVKHRKISLFIMKLNVLNHFFMARIVRLKYFYVKKRGTGLVQ